MTVSLVKHDGNNPFGIPTTSKHYNMVSKIAALTSACVSSRSQPSLAGNIKYHILYLYGTPGGAGHMVIITNRKLHSHTPINVLTHIKAQ